MVNNIKKHGGTKFNIIVTVIGVVLSVVLAMILLWVYISISQICIACFVMMFALAGVYMEYRGESELRIITFACSWTLGIEDLLWLSIEDLLHSPLPIVLAVMNIWVVITSIYMYRKLTIEMIKNNEYNDTDSRLFTIAIMIPILALSSIVGKIIAEYLEAFYYSKQLNMVNNRFQTKR